MASDKRQEIEDLSFLFPYLYQLFFSFCFASFSTLFILQAAKSVAQVKRNQREKISLRELFKKGQKKRCSRGAYLRPSADFLREKRRAVPYLTRSQRFRPGRHRDPCLKIRERDPTKAINFLVTCRNFI